MEVETNGKFLLCSKQVVLSCGFRRCHQYTEMSVCLFVTDIQTIHLQCAGKTMDNSKCVSPPSIAYIHMCIYMLTVFKTQQIAKININIFRLECKQPESVLFYQCVTVRVVACLLDCAIPASMQTVETSHSPLKCNTPHWRNLSSVDAAWCSLSVNL